MESNSIRWLSDYLIMYIKREMFDTICDEEQIMQCFQIWTLVSKYGDSRDDCNTFSKVEFESKINEFRYLFYLKYYISYNIFICLRFEVELCLQHFGGRYSGSYPHPFNTLFGWPLRNKEKGNHGQRRELK